MSDYAYYSVSMKVRITSGSSAHNATLTFSCMGGETAGAAMARAVRLVPTGWEIDDMAGMAKVSDR